MISKNNCTDNRVSNNNFINNSWSLENASQGFDDGSNIYYDNYWNDFQNNESFYFLDGGENKDTSPQDKIIAIPILNEIFTTTDENVSSFFLFIPSIISIVVFSKRKKKK